MGVPFGKISVDMPDHVVVHRAQKYQIWRYPPAIAATVRASDLQLPANATENDFTSAAFRSLARYIGVFGSPQNQIAGNETGEKIAMPAPVEVTTGDDAVIERDIRNMQMSFFLPSKYRSISEAPIPTNEAVQLVTIPSRYDAVVEFSGNLHMSASAQKAETLLQQLRQDELEIVGKWSYCGYNPPFTIPWMKRNEVHIPIDGARFHGIERSIE